MHYGIKRRSGRYPYGSGNRPYQGNNKNKLIFSKDISKEAFNKIQKIHNSLSKDEKRFLGDMLVSKYTRYINIIDNSYITLDDYNGKYKDKHPYNGLIISIASSKSDRGKGNTDKLIKYAINESGHKPLIAEIDKDNMYSKKLFERNGFKKIDEINDIMFYRFDKDIKHSQEGEVKFKMNEYFYLSHGGPGSGRYPLGSGERPYQKFEDSRKKRSGGIVGYIKSRRAKKREAELQKSAAEERARKLEAAREKQKMEADKERVLRSGTAQEVLKYRGELTNQELNTVAERLRLEKQISGYSADEIKTNLDKLKQIQAYTNVGAALAKDGASIYNSFVSIYNSTSAGKKDPLSPIKEKGDEKKKK